MLKLYNTLTRKKEIFKPLDPPRVGMYTCGMTVYDHTHLGHMRTYINTDFLRRTLEYDGYKVFQVENITDVGHLTSDADSGEDKMERRARDSKVSVWELSEKYTKEFYETTDALNILRPHKICKATEHIKEMIALIKKLEAKGFTYIIPDDGVYFDTARLPDYGKLARLDLGGLRAGARIEMVPGKRNITDFALWKFTPEGERRQMEWESPWAKKSFPGWHIECSAMSMKYLGETFDLHTGGVDHIPVHHTDEVAQSEAATGKPFVKYWFHNEHLMVEGQKMSKSLGNFYWLKDVRERGFEPLALRYLFLTAHYRSQMNFTWEALAGAQKALKRLRREAGSWRLDFKLLASSFQPPASSLELQASSLQSQASEYKDRFLAAINDDLDLPRALALTWELVKSDLPEADKYAALLEFDKILGLKLSGAVKKLETAKVPKEVRELVERREALRAEGEFTEADKVRKQIFKLGYRIEDTPKGPKISDGLLGRFGRRRVEVLAGGENDVQLDL